MVLEVERHLFRLAVDIVTTIIAMPSLVLHELAHYVACLPFGGPDGVYLLYDPSRLGLRASIPTGAAIYHTEIDGWTAAIPTLAPLAWVPIAILLRDAIVTPAGGIAVAVVFLAGIIGLTDALKLVDSEVYEDLLVDAGATEARLFIDLTAWSEGLESPPAVETRAS